MYDGVGVARTAMASANVDVSRRGSTFVNGCVVAESVLIYCDLIHVGLQRGVAVVEVRPRMPVL